MQPTNYIQPANPPKTIKKNGELAFLALFLIVLNSFILNGLLMSLGQDSNLVKRLWEPPREVQYMTAPTFAFVCIIAIWIIAPKATEFKKIFRVVGIITIILYTIGLVFLVYAIGLASGNK